MQAPSSPAMPAILSPSSIARYFFHGCDRFLRLRTMTNAGRRAAGLGSRPFDTSAVMEALQERGIAWEEEVVGQTRPRPLVAAGTGRPGERYHPVEATLALLRSAATQPIYQPTLRPRGRGGAARGRSASFVRQKMPGLDRPHRPHRPRARQNPTAGSGGHADGRERCGRSGGRYRAASHPTVRTKPLDGNDEDGADGADAKSPHPSAPEKTDGQGWRARL